MFACTGAFGQQATTNIEAGFKTLPNSAKPRAWWHWMNGNITKAGIKLDLEWMQRAGIGGFQNFDAALGTPKLVDKRLVYMTPEWKDAFRYATTLADQLGLEEAIAGSPGWSESGGPWVKPSQGMTKLVWSETHIEGGHPLASALPKPPDVSGPFQNIPIFDFLAVLSKEAPAQSPKFYADAAVVAFRLPNTDLPMSSLQPKITSSDGTSMDSTILSDGDLVKSIALHKAPTGRRAWVLFEFPAAQRMRALTLALGGPVNPFAESMGGLPPGQDVEASDDGQTFKKIATVPSDGAVQHTIAFRRPAQSSSASVSQLRLHRR